jgi:hypothetical protein
MSPVSDRHGEHVIHNRNTVRIYVFCSCVWLSNLPVSEDHKFIQLPWLGRHVAVFQQQMQALERGFLMAPVNFLSVNDME